MLALNITDIKDFTNKLFIGDAFDSFWMTEASFTTFSVFSIDGKLQKDFFDTDEQNTLTQNSRDYALWKEMKPYCFSIIRGKRTPLHFRIVFQFPPDKLPELYSMEEDKTGTIGNLYLNIQYRNHSLVCTTGTSLKNFIPGIKPGPLWDDRVLHFLRQNQISFEEM